MENEEAIDEGTERGRSGRLRRFGFFGGTVEDGLREAVGPRMEAGAFMDGNLDGSRGTGIVRHGKEGLFTFVFLFLTGFGLPRGKRTVRRNGTHERMAEFGYLSASPRKEDMDGNRKEDEEDEGEESRQKGVVVHGKEGLFVLEKRLRNEFLTPFGVEGGLVDDGSDGEHDPVVLRPPGFGRTRERDIFAVVVGEDYALIVVEDGKEATDVGFVVVFSGENGLVVEESGAFSRRRKRGGRSRERVGHGKKGLFVLENVQGGLEMDWFVRGIPDDPIREMGSVLLEEVSEQGFLAFEEGVIFGVGEKEVEIGASLLVDESIDEGVVAFRNADAVESRREFEYGLEVEIEGRAEMVGGHLLRGHPKRDYRGIGHFAEGAGFLPELDTGDGKRRVLVLGVRTEGFAVRPGNVDLDFVLVLVEDVQTLVVNDEGMAGGTFDFAIGLFPAYPDDLGAGVLVDGPGKEVMGGNPGEVDAVVETGNDAGLGGVDSEEIAKIGEILGVRSPKETHEFDVVVERLGFRLQLRSEVYGGHHVPERVENVEDFQFRAGDEPEPLDPEIAEIEGHAIGIRNDSEKGGDSWSGAGEFDREEVAVFVEDENSFFLHEIGGLPNPRGTSLVFHFFEGGFWGNRAWKTRNLGEACVFGLPLRLFGVSEEVDGWAIAHHYLWWAVERPGGVEKRGGNKNGGFRFRMLRSGSGFPFCGGTWKVWNMLF